MTVFQWGILGTGNIASSMAKALALVPDAMCAAVASRTLNKARTFADRWGISRAHGSYDALLADPSIDIVYVATPNACHKDNILAALAAGKHVLCEKPMTLSASDSAACFDAAEKRGLFLMEALWTAFFPAMQKAIELVQSGAIGTPRHLSANFISYRDPKTHPTLFDPGLGGGARNDLGIYPVAAALLLAGPIANATVKSVHGPTGVDEMTAMVLEHENGCIAQLACGFRVEMPIAVRVTGDLGHLDIAENFHRPRQVCIASEGQSARYDLEPLGVGYAHEVVAMQSFLTDRDRPTPTWGRAETLACARVLEGR
ncbi:MAG: Gfo/Idh/MocA family oxidoreductase [Pseudomonadota bacterium]